MPNPWRATVEASTMKTRTTVYAGENGETPVVRQVEIVAEGHRPLQEMSRLQELPENFCIDLMILFDISRLNPLPWRVLFLKC